MEDRQDFNPDELLDRAIDAVLHDPTPEKLPPEQVAQLVDVVRRAADRPHPMSLAERIKNMKPTTKIAAAAAVLIALIGLLSWLAPDRGTALAFADVADALANVRTAKWKMTSVVKRPNAEPETVEAVGMFLAPSHERTERTQMGQTSINIFDGQKNKGLALTPATKSAVVFDFKNMPAEAPLGKTFVGLRESALQAKTGDSSMAQQLGLRDIDGRRAEGFRMELGANVIEIWADPETSLPIRVEQSATGATEVRIVMTDFEVDLDLDESLFSLDPPEGYSVQQMDIELPKRPLVMLARTLGTAAECNDGVFPPTLRGENGIDGMMPRVAAMWQKKYGADPAEAFKEGNATAEFQKQVAELSMNLGGAFAILNALSPKHDWHYAGKDVKLDTPNRPIFWWRLRKAGDYEVIYADLSVKDVAAEDLPKLPPAEDSPTP